MEEPARNRSRDVAAIGIAAWLVAACGGGEGQGDRPPSIVSPEHEVAVSITLDPPGTVEGTNRIALTWRVDGAPTTFDVFVRHAADEEFVAITDAAVENDAAQFARGAAWRYDWPTASVRVRACDAQQRCADSNEQPLLEALANGVVKLRAEPLPTNVGAYGRFGFSSDGNTLNLASEPLSAFHRGTDGRWTQDDTVPARSGGHPFFSGDGNTLAIGLPYHRGTVGGIGAPEEEPPPDSAPEFPSNADRRGAVAVYVRDAAGAWQQQVFIKADVPTDEEYFGLGVVLSDDGNSMVVNTFGRYADGDTKLYLYERKAGVWQLAWQFRNRPFRHLQGATISADGKTVAVSVYGWRVVDNPGGYGDGDQIPRSMLHIYRRCLCSEGWELAAEFESERNTGTPLGSDDAYASTLSLSADGKTLAVGASKDSGGAGDDGTGPNEESRSSGAVYIYGEGANRRWERRAFVKTPTAPPHDAFGGSVKLRADGRAFVASACGKVANAPGVRRLHRADALQIDEGSCFDGSNFYVFEVDEEGRWRHTAAALVPNAMWAYAMTTASADLQTIGVQTFTGMYVTAVY